VAVPRTGTSRARGRGRAGHPDRAEAGPAQDQQASGGGVVLMGVKTAALIEHGRARGTPVAVVVDGASAA
jgi:hypothetical protein